MYQGFINLAQFVGACINEGTNYIPNKWAWRATLMAMLSVPLLMLAFLPFIPETPSELITPQSKGYPQD